MHTSKKYGLTEAMENELIKQLGLLFSIAVDQGYFDTNPIGDIINKLNKQNNQKNRMDVNVNEKVSRALMNF